MEAAGIGAPGAGVPGRWKPPEVVPEIKLGSYKEQYRLETTDPPLQAPLLSSVRWLLPGRNLGEWTRRVT